VDEEGVLDGQSELGAERRAHGAVWRSEAECRRGLRWKRNAVSPWRIWRRAWRRRPWWGQKTGCASRRLGCSPPNASTDKKEERDSGRHERTSARLRRGSRIGQTDRGSWVRIVAGGFRAPADRVHWADPNCGASGPVRRE